MNWKLLNHEGFFCLINFYISINGITFTEYQETALGHKTDYGPEADKVMINYFVNTTVPSLSDAMKEDIYLIGNKILTYQYEKKIKILK